MLNSQILEVAIGLAFVYLLLCLICSMVKEWIASAWLKSRPKTLFKGITSLLKDPKIIDDFYKHPLINALAKVSPDDMALEGLESSLRKQPSSIPSRTFALALLDILAPAKNAPGAQTLPDIRNKVSQPESPDWIKRALLPLLDAAPKDDLKAAYRNVEKWYDDAMERVTGWYKRRTQLYLLILGLLVCIAMNVDTFAIANSLYHDSALRSAVVAAAEKRIKESPPPPAPPSPATKAGGKAPAAPAADKAKGAPKAPETAIPPAVASPGSPAGATAPPPQPTPGNKPGTKTEKKPIEPDLKQAITQVQNLNLPIGWVEKSYLEPKDGKPIESCEYIPMDWNLTPLEPHSWWFKILGWIFTALAISLGAPFWFDLLNKLVNLRGAGKTPEPAAKKK